MPDKNAVAMKLAALHYEIEPTIRGIYAIRESPQSEALPTTPIKLLEVNDATPAMGIEPLQFGPSEEIPFSTIIIEVTPAEFEQIKIRQLGLPNGWQLGEELPRGGA